MFPAIVNVRRQDLYSLRDAFPVDRRRKAIFNQAVRLALDLDL